ASIVVSATIQKDGCQKNRRDAIFLTPIFLYGGLDGRNDDRGPSERLTVLQIVCYLACSLLWRIGW
ncbi:MAG: hypothetical protein ACREEM_46960, partial [Blastocatellia bacterium]